MVYFNRPKALLTMTAKSLITRSSFVHWPSPLFDEEIRQHIVNGMVVWVVTPRPTPPPVDCAASARPTEDGAPKEHSPPSDREEYVYDDVVPVSEIQRAVETAVEDSAASSE
jgi:hypothetical protein